MIRIDLNLIQRVRLTLHTVSTEEEAINARFESSSRDAEVIAAFPESNYNTMNFNLYSTPIISEKPFEVSPLLALFLAFSLTTI